MKKCFPRKGFTLLEVLITVVVISAGITALLPTLSRGMVSDGYTEDMIIALNLAQEKMEEIKSSATYAGINGYASAKAALTGDFAHFQREVIVASDPKEVQVIIYWTARGGEQSFSLGTLFADYDY